MLYDVVIIGGGPAGVSAGVYAARKKLKTVVVTDVFGGQSVVSNDIQNFIGTPSISGFELAQKLEGHLRAQEDVRIVLGDKVSKIEKKKNENGALSFAITTERGETFDARAVLITAGSNRRRLDVPGERELDGKGVAYCATCDAPLFRGKRVAVVGGGNSALEGARDLIPYASEIYLFVRSALKGDPVTQEKVLSDAKVHLVCPAEIVEIRGSEAVESVRYRLRDSGEERDLPLDGIFIEIGWTANAGIAEGLVELNAGGEIVVDHKTQRTSAEGIWAAGDVTDALYKQNNTSMGDAIKAVLNINDHLHAS
jgi:alkyl hydroperoxide reductase subunit F